MKDEEKKYKEVISALKSLPRLKAKSDFEQKLYRKLRNAEPEKTLSPAFEKLTRPKESNWIFSIFRPSLVPAVGLTLVLIAVIVIYINFIPQNDKLTESEKPVAVEELVIKDPGSTEKSTSNRERNEGEMITHDVAKDYKSDERSPLPVTPTSDVDIDYPKLSEPKKTDDLPLMEQTIEKREAEEKIFEKEGLIERKSDDMKKVEKKESIRNKETDQETNLKKNIGDEIYQTGVQPSRGLDKGKSKDSLKTDSVETGEKKIESNENGKLEQNTETQKQAEPIQKEPDKKEN